MGLSGPAKKTNPTMNNNCYEAVRPERVEDRQFQGNRGSPGLP